MQLLWDRFLIKIFFHIFEDGAITCSGISRYFISKGVQQMSVTIDRAFSLASYFCASGFSFFFCFAEVNSC